MSKKPRFQPEPRDVLIVVFPGFQLLDAAGPIAAFEIASRFVRGAYRLRLAAAAGGMAPSSSGVAMPAEMLGGFRFAGVDTLLIVGGQGTRAAMTDAKLIGALQRAAKTVRRMSSVCSGAFVLAVAGLLDGKRATTHWRQAPALAQMFPEVTVEPDRIHIKDGKIWTSAGVSAGIDLA